MGCLYFIPSRHFENNRTPDTVKGEELTRLGLGHLHGAPLSYRVARAHGPDGGGGLVIGLRTPANETGIFPGEQEWTPVDGANIFVGWPKGKKPGPEVFERDDAPGARLYAKLGDGRQWGFIPSNALPKLLTVDSAGEMVRQPRVDDQAHYDASEWLFKFIVEASDGEDLEVNIPEAWGKIIDCLATLYWLDFNTGLALGLFEDSMYFRAAATAIGVDYSKKNETPSTADSSHGGEDSPPA